MVSMEKMGHFSAVWAQNPQVKRNIKCAVLDTGTEKHLPKQYRVCGNPTVTHTPYLHTPLSFLSHFLCLFHNDSINSSCSSKTKCCLVKLYGRTWSHTRHLHSKARVTIVLTPEQQCFTCKKKKCRIYLCLSKSFLIWPLMLRIKPDLPLPMQQMTDNFLL